MFLLEWKRLVLFPAPLNLLYSIQNALPTCNQAYSIGTTYAYMLVLNKEGGSFLMNHNAKSDSMLPLVVCRLLCFLSYFCSTVKKPKIAFFCPKFLIFFENVQSAYSM